MPPILLHENSFSAAKALLDDIKKVDNPLPALQHAMAYGCPVGSMKRHAFSNAVVADIARFFTRQCIPIGDIPHLLLKIKYLALRDELGIVERFCAGTTCKIESENEEWTMEIADIFLVGPVNDQYFVFVNGPYFIPTLNNGNVIHNDWTQTPQLIARNYIRDSIQPACKVRRKVMMYPDPSDLRNPAFYLCIDFKKPELMKDVDVPVYPMAGERIQVLDNSSLRRE